LEGDSLKKEDQTYREQAQREGLCYEWGEEEACKRSKPMSYREGGARASGREDSPATERKTPEEEKKKKTSNGTGGKETNREEKTFQKQESSTERVTHWKT